MNRRGLSLIEVIVCIAIVMILGGVCYAAMGPARESARQRVCVSNLKQIGAALQMYMNDYGGIEPSVGTASTDVDLGLPPVNNLLNFAEGYVRNRSVLRCPNYRPLRGEDPLMMGYWWSAIDGDGLPLASRFSQIVKKRGGETPIMGCEYHHPEYDLSVEPRWTLAKVIFLRLNGSVESRYKPVREYSTTW